MIVLMEKIRMIFFQNPNLKNHCLKSEQFFNISLFILIHFFNFIIGKIMFL